MKHIIAFIPFFLFSSFVFAQVPNEIEGINYQGIVRESDGSPITFTNVEIKIGIYNLSNTSPVFEETHTVTTNEFGLFNLIIGTGSINTGNILTSSLWNEAVEIKTEADYGSGYDEIGTVNLAAVPYAFKAKYEGQKIDFNTTSGYLRISDGTIDANNNPVFIDSTQISVSGGGTDDQRIIDFELTSTNMLNIEIEDGNTMSVDLSDLIDDSDADPANEIQDLNLNSTTNILTITNNSGATNIDLTPYIELPTTATTGQVLTWNGSSWIAQNSGTGADNWGSQVVNTSGGNISGNGTSGSPLTVSDGDSDATNEIELPNGGTNGQILSTDGSGNYTWVNDNSIDLDNDPNNEIELPAAASTGQVLTWNGSAWVAQNTLSGSDNWGTQSVVTGSGLSGNGTSGSPLINTFTEVDGDNSNELQTITKSGSTVTLSNGGGSFTDDNTQLTESQVDTYVSNNGYLTSFSEVDGDITNEIQTLSISGTSLSLSSGGGSITLPTGTDNQDLTNSISGSNATINISGGTGTTFSINDADSDPTNEYNTGANLTGNNLNIIDGGGTQTVDLSILSEADNDWFLGGSTTTKPSSINDEIWKRGKIGVFGAIGGSTISHMLTIGQTSNTTTPMVAIKNAHTTGDASMVFQGGTSYYSIGSDAGNSSFTISQNSTGLGSNDRLVIKNSTGNIGIGTSSPTEKLYIQSNDSDLDLETNSSTESSSIHFRRSSGTSGSPSITPNGQYFGNIQFQGYTGSGFRTAARIEGSTDGTQSTSQTNGKLTFFTTFGSSEFERMRITNDGNIGIGTTTPSVALDVIKNGSNIYVANITNTNATNSHGLKVETSSTSSNNTIFYAKSALGNSDFIIKSDGDIGVGTTTPSTKLEVNGTITIDNSADPNELNRSSTGNANLVPIAYANISSSGNINTSSTNVSVNKTGTGQYLVNVAGETLNTTNCIVSINTQNSNPRFVGYGSSGGGIYVYIRNSSSGFIDNAFSISIFKP